MSDKDKELKCDPEQLKHLLKCLEEGDIKAWNKWREETPDEKIWLEGIDLSEVKSTGPKLPQQISISFPNTQPYAQKINLQGAHLKGANLKNFDLYKANFQGADLEGAHFEEAVLWQANFQGAVLQRAHFEGAKLRFADLEGAKLWQAHLEGAVLQGAHLKGTELPEAHLEGANFHLAKVDSDTFIGDIEFNENTDFTGVALDNCRIDPRLKVSLKTIIRKKQWETWYQENPLLKIIVCPFWKMSNYGSSTGRIITWFFGLAFSFGLIYWKFNDLVSGLKDNSFPLLRSMYFSVVTMTTLGFGDMYAAKDSYMGHILLMIQVILGYVLLGALITRLGILFTQEGPAYPIPSAKINHGSNPCLICFDKIKSSIKAFLKQIPTKFQPNLPTISSIYSKNNLTSKMSGQKRRKPLITKDLSQNADINM